MEKRKHERFALDDAGWRAELIDQVSGRKLGDVVNLSAQGMLMIAPQPVEVDNLYQVECLSRGPRDQTARFNAGLVVLWTSPTSDSDTSWAGLQIIDIDAQSREALTALKTQLSGGG